MSVYRAASLASRRGTVAVEYAFIVPVLLLFVVGIMDTGRLIWTTATLNRAAAAAARCAAVNPAACGTAAQIKSYAVTQAFGLNIASTAFTPSTVACGSKVAATYSFRFYIPWVGSAPYGSSNSMTLNATACYPPSH